MVSKTYYPQLLSIGCSSMRHSQPLYKMRRPCMRMYYDNTIVCRTHPLVQLLVKNVPNPQSHTVTKVIRLETRSSLVVTAPRRYLPGSPARLY